MERLLAFLLLAATVGVASDLKVTTVSGPLIDPQSAESNSGSASFAGLSQTIYVHGSSQRVEFNGLVPGQVSFGKLVGPYGTGTISFAPPRMAVITHCDTGIIDELDLDNREYREFKGPRYPSKKEFTKLVEHAKKESEKEIQASTVDTGETKELFGHSARRLVTTVRQETAAYTPAMNYIKTSFEETLDGWYLDIPAPGCAPEYMRSGQATPITYWLDITPPADIRGPYDPFLPNEWEDFQAYSSVPEPRTFSVPLGHREVTRLETTSITKTQFIYTGFIPAGLAVAQNVSGQASAPATQFLCRDCSGPRSAPATKWREHPWSYKVTEFSEAPLDPVLFTVPPDFKKVKRLYLRDIGRHGG